MFFSGSGPGQQLRFYQAPLLRELSVTGRVAAAAPGTNFTFNVDCSYSPGDAIWLLGLSFARSNTPGSLLLSPAFADPVDLTLLSPPRVASLPITLQIPTGTTWTPSSLALQAAYLDLSSTLFVSRVTELPIF